MGSRSLVDALIASEPVPDAKAVGKATGCKAEDLTMIQAFSKRAFDVTLSLIALIALTPLLVAVGLAIKLSSPGPMFFRQERVGRNGVPFWLYKFRTMCVAAEGPVITTADDKRITRLGRFLRHWKLDELPQLLNVLRGDMSLVGPRPQVAKYVNLYNSEERLVLAVRPGLTGPYQVHFPHYEQVLAAQPDPEAYYATTHLYEKLALELEYVRHHSLLADLQLILRTLPIIYKRRSLPEAVETLKREQGSLTKKEPPRQRGAA